MSQKHQVGVNSSLNAISKLFPRMQLLNIPKLKLGNRLQKGLRELYNVAWSQKCSTIFYWYVKYGAFEASLDETRYQGCMRRLEVVNSHWLLSMSISASNVWNGNARDRCLILIHCTYRHVCVTLKSFSYNRDHPRYNVSSKQQTAGDAAICPLDLHQRPGHDAQGWGASILGHAPRCSQQGKHDMPRYLKGGFSILWSSSCPKQGTLALLGNASLAHFGLMVPPCIGSSFPLGCASALSVRGGLKLYPPQWNQYLQWIIQ